MKTGRPIGEEYTIALVAEHLLAKKPGRVVINLSTTKAVEDIAASHGVPLPAHTGRRDQCRRGDDARQGARIGGEGNGGVISPEVHLGRDSLVGIGYVLEMMAERGKNSIRARLGAARLRHEERQLSLAGKGIDQGTAYRA